MSQGKKYGSKASAFQVIIQGPRPIRHPSTGDIIDYKKELVAEFALHGREVEVPGPNGQTIKSADINGHYFDSAMQAEEKGWTDEERERVEAGVDKICKQQPGQVWLLEEVRLDAPWPTYEEMHHKKIPGFAIDAGKAVEALAYERQREHPRPEIIGLLEQHLGEVRLEAEAEQALTAA